MYSEFEFDMKRLVEALDKLGDLLQNGLDIHGRFEVTEHDLGEGDVYKDVKLDMSLPESLDTSEGEQLCLKTN